MDQQQHRNYSTSEQFTFLGRHRPNSLQVIKMDPHQHRNYATSEQFTIHGRHRPNFLPVVKIHGRNFNPENTSLAQERSNLTRGEVHSHYHPNPGSWSNVHHASNFSSEMPCLGQISSGPLNVAHLQFAGYDGGTHNIDIATAAGRFPFKRKIPDVPTVFDIGNSSWGPSEGRSSMSGLLNRQIDDDQNVSQYTTSFQQYSRGNHPNILNDSGRNVRRRSGPYLAPTPITSHHFHATSVSVNHSVPTHNPHINAIESAARNFNSASSHGPVRIVSEGVSSEANQFLAGRYGVEAGQYSYNPITGRNTVPPSQDVEAYGNNIPQTIPTRTWGSTSLSYREHTRQVGDGYETTSNYHLQLPTEAYSSRYSRSSSTQRWRNSYRNDRARGGIERYLPHATIDRTDRSPPNGFRARFRLRFPIEAYSPRYPRSYTTATGHTIYQSDGARSTNEHALSHAPAINRNGSMETRQHVVQDDMLTYYPRPRYTNVIQGDMFTYYPRPRDTDVIQEDMFTYYPRPRNTDVIQDDMFTYYPRPRDTDVIQDDMFTYCPRPRDTNVLQDDMFTYFPRPRDADVLQDVFTDIPTPRDIDAYDEYEDMRLDIDNMSYEELLALEEHIENVNTGLSEEEISNCLVESWNCSSEQNKEERICPICLDDSNMDKAAKLRSCGHEFHVHCITIWLGMKNVCPLCKRPVNSDS